MKYLEFIDKLNYKENINNSLIVNYFIDIIFENNNIFTTEEKNIIDKINNYKLDTILTGINKIKSEKNIKKRLSDKCNNIDENFIDEISDILSKYYKESLLNIIECKDIEILIKFFQNELINQKIDLKIKDEFKKIVNLPDFNSYCTEISKEDIENNLKEFKNDFKEKMSLEINNMFINIKNTIEKLDEINCIDTLEQIKHHVNNVIEDYVKNKNPHKINICIALFIRNSFYHIYNSQYNGLKYSCQKNDIKNMKKYINYLTDSLTACSNNNIINGNDSFYKTGGILVNDEIVKSILENIDSNQILKFYIEIIKLARFLIIK